MTSLCALEIRRIKNWKTLKQIAHRCDSNAEEAFLGGGAT